MPVKRVINYNPLEAITMAQGAQLNFIVMNMGLYKLIMKPES